MTDATKNERLHALDAVRMGALLLGVVLHATMSFLPGEQVWMIRDEQSTTLGLLFYVPHIFRMSLFFLLAGFFARMSLHKKGLREFTRDRLKRIALPLVTFWPILFAAVTAAFIWGIARQWGPAALEAIPQPEGGILQTLPLTHLWFLYVLLGLYAAALALRQAITWIDRRQQLRRGIDRLVGAGLRSGLAPLLLAAPTALALYLRQDWLMWFGVPTPDRGLIPNAAALAAYGTAFGFGWLLHRQIDLLRLLERRFASHLLVAVTLSAASFWIAGGTVTLDPTTQLAAADPVLRVLMAVGYPLATWAWTFGLIGLALRVASRPSTVIRYAADSSYWVYLIHLPLIMVAQVLVFPFQLPALLKFSLVLLTTTPLMLLSYQLMVRYSFIGAMLNGRRHERRRPKAEDEQELATATR